MRLATRRGQSTLEYAVLIAVVIGALVSMQIYLKRGTQGKLRSAGDQVGEQFNPYGTVYNFTTTTNGARQDNTTTNGLIASNITETETRNRSGNENVISLLNQENLIP